jgi:hypothetical protein
MSGSEPLANKEAKVIEFERKDLFEEEEVQQHLKAPYDAPRLVVHGTVETITQYTAGQQTDG